MDVGSSRGGVVSDLVRSPHSVQSSPGDSETCLGRLTPGGVEVSLSEESGESVAGSRVREHVEDFAPTGVSIHVRRVETCHFGHESWSTGDGGTEDG